MEFDKLIIDSIDLVSAFDITTGELAFMLDEVKDGTFENAMETVWVTGKSGRRIAGLDRNKTAKFTFNNGFFVGGAMASQVGTAPTLASESSKFTVPTYEIITVGATTTEITLANVPVGTSGAEIPFIYAVNTDGTQGAKYGINATASATQFALVPATKKITLPTSVFETGDRVLVFYNYDVSLGKKYVNSGDKFAKTLKVVVDITMRDSCDNSTIYHGKLIMKKGKLDGTFSVSISDTPEAHNVVIEAVTDICSTDKELWTWYIV